MQEQSYQETLTTKEEQNLQYVSRMKSQVWYFHIVWEGKLKTEGVAWEGKVEQAQ